MELDYALVDGLKRNHPAWRLLAAEHAPLLVSFLYRVFVKSNARGLEQSKLVSLLEDELYRVRELRGSDSFPRSAADYLEDWAQDTKGWLRKYYPAGSDEAHYDLTPGGEKAITWVDSLGARSFVGTESRLRLVFDLLHELVAGSGADPEATIKELRRQKAELERRIARIKAGEADQLDETAVRERFLHMAATAREILSDFREVEQNFRDLDRSTRESIASWEGAKGQLLESILGRRDAIDDSDQGKSFRAFWDFLMSADRQDALGAMLDAAFAMPAINALSPEKNLKRVHFDWMEAGERTQRTVALLSSQLRRFLDDQVWMENRRIMELLRSIEAKALDCRDDPPAGPVSEMAAASADITLPMERPLFSPPLNFSLDSAVPEAGNEELDTGPLFAQWAVDREVLRARIAAALDGSEQISLSDLSLEHPYEHGLTELMAYLSLAGDSSNAAFSETDREQIGWTDPAGPRRAAILPRVIFTKENSDRAE
jgi:hypothetical protein